MSETENAAARARPVKWVAMESLGSFVARTWRGDIIARPMNADRSMSDAACEEAYVEPGSEYYDQMRAFIVEQTGDFPRPPEDPQFDGPMRTKDWTIVPAGPIIPDKDRWRIVAKCATCGGDNGTDYPHKTPWPCGHCGTPIIRAPLMTVGEIRRALGPFSDDQIVVLDVDLAKCHSDRNVMHIDGIRPDAVNDGAPWVFIDAGDHARP